MTGPSTITGSPCTTTGVVFSVTVTTHGSGYTSPPTVAFSGGGGSGATATAILGGSGVTSVAVTAGGSGYTSRPIVVFTGTPGSGAGALAVLTGTSVTSVAVTAGGSGYTSAPTVAISGFSGTGATAMAVLTGSVVTSIILTNGGAGYTGAPAVSFSGGGGSGATASSVLTPTSVASLTVVASGSGYTTAPTVSFTGGGGGAGATATASIGTQTVSAVTVISGGTGYTSAPTVSFSGGGGSGVVATSKLSAQCCMTYGGTGSYTFTVTPSYAGYSTTTSTITLTCNVSTLITFAPTAASGYSCTPNACCPGDQIGSPPYAAINLPTTIYVSDGFGLVTLTKYVLSGVNTWYGCATRTAAQGATNCTTPQTHGANVSVPVMFVLACNSAAIPGAWSLTVYVPVYLGGVTTYPTTGTCDASTQSLLNCNGTSASTNFALGGIVTGCNPFALTVTGNFASATGALQQIYGTGSVSMALTS